MRYTSFLLVALIFTFGACATDTPRRNTLLGRWRSDTEPTGYWIVDRFSDGRFAKKRYLRYDLRSPAEFAVEWGRWKLVGKNYSEITDGSTSVFIQKFAGKWYTLRVVRVTSEHFSVKTHDGAERDEHPEHDQNLLLNVEVKQPTEDASTQVIDTITPALGAIPAWVKEGIASNHAP